MLQWRLRQSVESQIESCEHQDNADIRHQPWPELVSEEQDIDADDDGSHRHHKKDSSHLSPHFCHPLAAPLAALDAPQGRGLGRAAPGIMPNPVMAGQKARSAVSMSNDPAIPA